MADQTSIEWADSTFNPWMGCSKVSPACDHCYAERDTARFGRVEWGAGKPRIRTSEASWRKPLQWNAKPFHECAECGWRGDLPDTLCCPSCNGCRFTVARRRVFCASLADVFDNEVDPQWRADLFDLIGRTPNLDWLLLTKRIGTAHRLYIESELCTDFPRNVWLGATICNEAEADRDIPKLLATPAAVRFLSIEPMLGPIDLTRIAPAIFAAKANALTGKWKWDGGPTRVETATIDWVICGGESGPKARPMHPAWVRSLREQCAHHGVPFLFKQWGEWAPYERRTGFDWRPKPGDHCTWWENQQRFVPFEPNIGQQGMSRVGRKLAGRQIDGKTHTGFPESAP
jgi:protein gp37